MELFDILTYDNLKLTEAKPIGDVYEPVLNLLTPVREEGKYEYKISYTYNFSSTTTSMYLRYRVNGSAWVERIKEPSDRSDIITEAYFQVNDVDQGQLSIDVEMRKENSTGNLNIYNGQAVIQRVGL